MPQVAELAEAEIESEGLDAEGEAGVLKFLKRAGLTKFGPVLVAMGVDNVRPHPNPKPTQVRPPASPWASTTCAPTLTLSLPKLGAMSARVLCQCNPTPNGRWATFCTRI